MGHSQMEQSTGVPEMSKLKQTIEKLDTILIHHLHPLSQTALSDALMILRSMEPAKPLDFWTDPHLVYCNADHRKPVGGDMCICQPKPVSEAARLRQEATKRGCKTCLHQSYPLKNRCCKCISYVWDKWEPKPINIRLQAEIDRLKIQVIKWQDRCGVQSSGMDRLEDENAQWQSSIKAVQEHRDRLKAELAESKGAYSTAQSLIRLGADKYNSLEDELTLVKLDACKLGPLQVTFDLQTEALKLVEGANKHIEDENIRLRKALEKVYFEQSRMNRVGIIDAAIKGESNG